MPEYLVIGGPNDGERIELDGSERDYIKLTEPIKTEVPIHRMSIADSTLTFEMHAYRRMQITVDSTNFVMYRDPTLSDYDVIRQLIQGYRKT